MKQKVIRIIKRLIGHRILVHPIVDANVYDANENSFSGNSLQDSNVLIVGCDETLMRSAECYYKNEGCYVVKLWQGYRELTTDDIRGKRILLAEDNELNAEIAIELLHEEGFFVELATDGQECFDMLDQAEEGYYDLILMDIQMPNVNGYEATVKIRQMENDKKAQIPIVAMTANVFAEDRKLALDLGMNGHISKPIDMKKVRKVLHNILNAE